MPLTLKKASGWPPGGYPFKDPRTGKVFDGMSADLGLQAKNVVIHRRGNPRVYPPNDTGWFDVGAIRQEIINYMCSLRPELCTDGVPLPLNEPAAFAVQKPAHACPKCGSHEASPVYCKTCSGQKITGWKCVCGTERPK